MTTEPRPRIPRGRTRLYPWNQHARYLRDHPDRWVLLETSLTSGTIQHVRAGHQQHMGRLRPHLELRTRNRQDPPDGGSPRWELWARYTPDKEVPIGAQIPPDELVRSVRLRFQAGDTLRELAKDTGFPVTTIGSWVRGRTRRDAGGPIGPRQRRAADG